MSGNDNPERKQSRARRPRRHRERAYSGEEAQGSDRQQRPEEIEGQGLQILQVKRKEN